MDVGIEALLASVAAHSSRPGAVKRIETHISVVFVNDKHVYKVKKALRFPFLDYSTLEKRLVACRDEVVLNRRLAPDVYLGVVPILRTTDGGLHFGDCLEFSGDETPSALTPGTGVVDYCVWMRRLPDDRMMHTMIANDALDDTDIARLCDRLVEFYCTARRADDVDRHASPGLIETNVRENLSTLAPVDHGLPPELFARVRASQLQYLAYNQDLFRHRIAAGRICEGHGDLRPEHVCFLEEPIVFDCVEFSLPFRSADIVSEVAFLAMECDFLGARHVGDGFLQEFLQRSEDDAPLHLVRFYQAYRATIRAKVEALRADQTRVAMEAHDHLQRARRYLQLAGFYALEFYTPQVVVVMGASGTGKTTLAEQLGEALGATILSTDTIRRDVLGPPSAGSEIGKGRYCKENVNRVYDEVLRRARKALAGSESIILDGTFREAGLRDHVRRIATNAGAEVAFVLCQCDPALAEERITRRRASGTSDSEAPPELHAHQLAAFEDMPDAEGNDIHPVDTATQTPEEVTRLVRAQFRRS